MEDFWTYHDELFLICAILLPRLTLIFGTTWGGPLWWLGTVFSPRFTIALLGSMVYWRTNPWLVALAWLAYWSVPSIWKVLLSSKSE